MLRCDRVGETKPAGVQRLAVDAPRIRVVEIVSDKGISDMFHMYAYLMGRLLHSAAGVAEIVG